MVHKVGSTNTVFQIVKQILSNHNLVKVIRKYIKSSLLNNEVLCLPELILSSCNISVLLMYFWLFKTLVVFMLEYLPKTSHSGVVKILIITDLDHPQSTWQGYMLSYWHLSILSLFCNSVAVVIFYCSKPAWMFELAQQSWIKISQLAERVWYILS